MHNARAVRRPTSSSGRSPRPASCSAARCTCRRRRTCSDDLGALVAAGHRRLGRRLAGHARPREPRAAVARRSTGSAPRPRPRARCSRRASPSTRSTCATPTRGSHPDVRFAGARARPTSKASPATTRGPRAATSRRRSLLPAAAVAGPRRRPGRRGARRRARAARRSASTRSSRCSARAGPRSRAVARGRRPAAARHRRRRRHLRPQPQHQLHEHLHVQVPVLRVLEGPALAQPARRPVPARPRGDPAARRRGRRVRRHRGVPAGRHPPRLRRRLLPRRRPRGEGGRARHPRARLHRARGHRRRAPARHAAARLPRAGQGRRASRRCPAPRPRSSTTRCGPSSAPTRSTPRSGSRRTALAHAVGLRSNVTIMFGTVERPVHVARHLVRTRDAAEGDGRVHRVRAAALRAHGHADLPPGPRPHGPDVPRGAAHARGRPHRVPRLDRQHPGLVGEGRHRRRAPGAAGRVQRPRRHADGREHLACRGREPRPGARRRATSARSSSRSAARSSSARRSTAGSTTVGRRLRPPPETHDRRAAGRRRARDRRQRTTSPSRERAETPASSRRSTSSAIGNALVDVLSHETDEFLDAHGLVKGVDGPHRHRAGRALYAAMGPAIEISGGSAANTMVGHRVVRRVAPRSSAGSRDDQLGAVFAPRHPRRGRRSSTRAPATDGLPTGRCLILVTPDAERTLNTYLGASAELGPSDVDADLVARRAGHVPRGLPLGPARGQGGVPARGAASRTRPASGSRSRSPTASASTATAPTSSTSSSTTVDILFANEAEICVALRGRRLRRRAAAGAPPLRDRRAHPQREGLGDRAAATRCT